MNLANKLTIFRIILVPIMVVFAYLPFRQDFYGVALAMIIMDIIFIIASITDKLDGYIARSRNQVTTFGKFLDPLADKILVLTAMLILVELDKLPAWIPIIVLAREFIVSGFRLIAVEKGGLVIAASVWGKLKTVTQMIAIIFAFIDTGGFFTFASGNLEGAHLVINIIASVMMAISTVATIFSGWDYVWKGRSLLKEEKSTNENGKVK